MKKFLAIILVLMLTFSVLLVSACKNDSAGTDGETSSATEESSSGRKRGEGATSGTTTSNTGTNPGGGDDPDPSGGDDPGDEPYTPPQDDDFVYGDYDYEYKITPTQPADGSTPAGFFDSLMCVFAEESSPSLNGEFYDTLVSNENYYNSLSQADKGAVINYGFLQEARRAYNDMAKKECEKIINELPDATMDNLIEFGRKAKAVDKLFNNIGGEANNVPNKALYEQKVAKADTLLINTFNEKVSALQNFEYTQAYKAKLDDADVIYGLMNASQQSKVSGSYATLGSYKTRYADAAVAYSFVDTVNALPDVNSLTDTDKITIKQLKKTYNKMSDAEKAEIPSDTKAKYDAYVAKAQQLWPEHVLYACDNNRRGDEFFKFSDQLSSASDKNENPVVYEAKKYTDCVKFKSGKTITFTITKPGVLTIYANVREKVILDDDGKKYPCDIILSLNGTEVHREAIKLDSTGENCEYTFPCNEVGTYTITCNGRGDGAYLYFLVFS